MEARGLGEEEGAEEAEGTRTEACEVVTAASAPPERRGGTEGKEDEEEEAERASLPPRGDGEPGFGEEAPS